MATKRFYYARYEKQKGYYVSSKKYPSMKQLLTAIEPHIGTVVGFGRTVKFFYEDIETAQ